MLHAIKEEIFWILKTLLCLCLIAVPANMVFNRYFSRWGAAIVAWERSLIERLKKKWRGTPSEGPEEISGPRQ